VFLLRLLPSQNLPLSKMAIRKARQSDLQAMAEISAAAFMDEELFGGLMHPHRKEYPEDFILFFKRKFLSHWYDSNRHFLVGLDKVSGKVIAVAEWERQGASTIGFTSLSGYLDTGKDETRSRFIVIFMVNEKSQF
jgi:hypothetical protein